MESRVSSGNLCSQSLRTDGAKFSRESSRAERSNSIRKNSSMQIRGPGGSKLARACFQFGGELHRGIIVQVSTY